MVGEGHCPGWDWNRLGPALVYPWRSPSREIITNCADISGDFFFAGRWKRQVARRANKVLQSETYFCLGGTTSQSKWKGSLEGQWMNSLHMGTAVFIFPRALQPAGCTGTLKTEFGMENGDGKRMSGQRQDGRALLQDRADLVPLKGWCAVSLCCQDTWDEPIRNGGLGN